MTTNSFIAITKQVKISLISENKSSKWTSEAKQEHVEKLANLNVSHKYKGRYKQLLVKHFGAISIDKNNLGRVKDVFHKIHLKGNEPDVKNVVQLWFSEILKILNLNCLSNVEVMYQYY